MKSKPSTTNLNLSNIPEELKRYDRWVLWKWVERGGKFTKPPMQPDGSYADSTNAETWVSYEEAAAAVDSFDGIGFALGTIGIGYICIDLDHCRDINTGALDDRAKQIVAELDSYTEVSPSQTGVKIWLRGNPPAGSWKHSQDNIEWYSDRRYLTCTGDLLPGASAEIKDAGSTFEKFLVERMAWQGSTSASTGAVTCLDDDDFLDAPTDLKATRESVTEALKFIDPDCSYNTWISVGFGLKWVDSWSKDGEDSLYDLWDMWSSFGDGYPGPEETQRKWDSFPHRGAIKDATIYAIAKEGGFVPPATRAASISYDTTEHGMALRVADRLQHRQVVYVHDWSQYWYWNGRCFEHDINNVLLDEVIATSKQLLASEPWSDIDDEQEQEKSRKMWTSYCNSFQSINKIKAVKEHLKGIVNCSFEDFNNNPFLFHVQNGVVDLKTGKLCPHDRTLLNTQICDLVYDSSAQCPKWLEFLHQITEGNQELIDYLQRMAGYCLTGSCREQAMFVLHGSGQNGKGVFTRILLSVLGKYGGSSDQSLIMSKHPDPYLAVCLYGRRCSILQETDEGARLNENRVKELTGDDPITARKLYQDFWTFTPTHKLILCTNHKPLILGSENGIWRRIKMIPFKVVFKDADIHLENKLRAELCGILRWCIEGAGKYFERGLAAPEAITRDTEEYREEMDIVGQWIDECCSVEETATAKFEELYASLRIYSESHGYPVLKNSAFVAKLKERGIHRVRDGNVRLWQGLRTVDTDFNDIM